MDYNWTNQWKVFGHNNLNEYRVYLGKQTFNNTWDLPHQERRLHNPSHLQYIHGTPSECNIRCQTTKLLKITENKTVSTLPLFNFSQFQVVLCVYVTLQHIINKLILVRLILPLCFTLIIIMVMNLSKVSCS